MHNAPVKTDEAVVVDSCVYRIFQETSIWTQKTNKQTTNNQNSLFETMIFNLIETRDERLHLTFLFCVCFCFFVFDFFNFQCLS